MRQLSEPLASEYSRWEKKAAESQFSPAAIRCALTPQDVLLAHFLICEYFIEEGEVVHSPGPKDLSVLMSAIGRQFTGFGGIQKWKNDFEVRSSLFFGLIKNHPFHDGNKRTALLCALYAMHRLRRVPTCDHRELERLAVRTAGSELGNYARYKRISRKEQSGADAAVRFIADFLRRNTRKMDSSYHVVTYRELAGILKKFDCRFGEPRKNFIDVFYKVKERRRTLFGRSAERVVEKKIQIGFPGWTKEVAVKAVSSIRRAAGLRTEDGVDSQVFFKDADPMAALIDRFHGPLRRLKDK